MIETRLTKLVGIKYPIIQAGMGPFPVTDLCIATANAGALGIMSTAGVLSRETKPSIYQDFIDHAHAEYDDEPAVIFKKMYTRVFEETKESGGIFGINVMVSAEVLDNAKTAIGTMLELREQNPEMKERFKVLITSAGDPLPWTELVKKHELVWMHVFPSVKAAKRCKKAGVQVLIASGHEGGFHTAWQPVHSMTLLPDVIEKCSDENTLVCGTGGFCDGKSLAAAFAMGADGVQMGTRFLATQESDFAPLWKQMLLDAGDGGTVIARGFVGPARWLRTATSMAHAKNTLQHAPGSYLGIPDDLTTIPEDLINAENMGLNATRAGDTENAMAAAGECSQRITDLPETKEMLETVMRDTEDILVALKDKYVVN